MSDATDRAQQYLLIAATSLRAMEVIGQATRGLVDKGDRATLDEILAVLTGIDHLADTIAKGLSGAVTREVIDAATVKLIDTIFSSNQTIDRELEQKFPPSA